MVCVMLSAQRWVSVRGVRCGEYVWGCVRIVYEEIDFRVCCSSSPCSVLSKLTTTCKRASQKQLQKRAEARKRNGEHVSRKEDDEVGDVNDLVLRRVVVFARNLCTLVFSCGVVCRL
jgi:hypothetical protein